MDQDKSKFFAGGFAPVSLETWRKAVEKALGGASIESLSSATDSGFSIRPLYTRADRTGPAPVLSGPSARWDICAVIDAPALDEAKAAMAAELEGGADRLVIRIAPSRELRGPWGVLIQTQGDLDALLHDVPGTAPIMLDGGASGLAAALALLANWKSRNVKPADVKGALNIDPLALAPDCAVTGALAKRADAEYPGLTTIAVDTRPDHAGGASEAQDVGLALAAAAETLRMLDKAGLPPERALRQIQFIFATSSHFFLSMIKLRAARLAFARFAELCGIAPGGAPMRIWAETAWRELTRRDAHVNMLRGTAGCFAAALGGADAISVRPFDEAITVPSPFARRAARNAQIILAEEAGLARVQDPANGAWFFEDTTHGLAKAGWEIFRSIEKMGGLRAARAAGHVAAMIAEISDKRAASIAHRTESLTGVSIYPDLAEPMVSRSAVDWPGLIAAANARAAASRKRDADAACATLNPTSTVDAVAAALGAGARFSEIDSALGAKPQSIAPHRLAEPFEALRDAADALPRRPVVFLANWGKPRDYLDAATFARNLFAAGGIEALGDTGYMDRDTLIRAARESGAKLIVLCTSAEKRAAEGAGLISSLRALEPHCLYVVGSPSDTQGADEALEDGTDVLALLQRAFLHLGARV